MWLCILGNGKPGGLQTWKGLGERNKTKKPLCCFFQLLIMFFKYESKTLFFQTTLCSSELCLTSQRLFALNSIKAAKSSKCLGIGTSFKGRGQAGGPYLTDKQKQTSSCLSVWQPEGRRVLHLHQPSQHFQEARPWQGQHGASDHGSISS